MPRPAADAAPFLGLISDTHGLVRPEALAALAGCERVVHAGDVGAAEVLRELGALAPVEAVRGNVDRDAWARELPEERVLVWRGRRVLVLHDRARLRSAPGALGVDAIVVGHSHRPAVEELEGVLLVNPGSAGPRRFRLPVSVGRLALVGGRLVASLHELALPPGPAVVSRRTTRRRVL